MTTSCITFLSKSGIVAVSDSDFSIRPLSKKFPGIIVVNTYSPIPWKTIIDDYLLENDSTSFSTLKEAHDSFTSYFKKRKISGSVLKKQSKDSLLFMGFNEKGIYPTLIEAEIENRGSADLEFSEFYERNISHEDSSFYNYIGNFDLVAPILAGASDSFMESVQKIENKLLSSYRAKLIGKMNDLSIESKWIDKVNDFDIETAVDEKICDSIRNVLNEVSVGIDTLSIQEMVDYAESLLNAEIRLRNLKHKVKGNPYGTREIAVVTIPEGLTWIKHHLFAI